MQECMVSEIQITPIKPRDGLVAFASCVVNNQFYLGNIAVYTALSSPGAYRLVYPSKMLSNGKEINIFYPINSSTYESVRKAVVKKLEELVEKVAERSNHEYPNKR